MLLGYFTYMAVSFVQLIMHLAPDIFIHIHDQVIKRCPPTLWCLLNLNILLKFSLGLGNQSRAKLKQGVQYPTEYIVSTTLPIVQVFYVLYFRWRVCFWVATVPAALLAICMEFCAESPHWLYKVFFFFFFGLVT